MKSFHQIFIVLLVLIFVLLSVGSALSESLTFDEAGYIEVGLRAWRESKLNIEPYNPVFIPMLTTLPLYLRVDVLFPPKRTSVNVFPARLVTIIFGCGIILITYKITKDFLNTNVALWSVLFLVFEPNILANSHYITYDTGSTFFFLVSYFFLLKFIDKPSLLSMILLGTSAGLAFSSKIPLVPFYFLSALILLFFRKKRNTLLWFAHNSKLLFFYFTVTVFTLWATYLFQWDYVIAPSERTGRVSEIILKTAQEEGNTLVVQAVRFLQEQKLPLGSYLALLKNNVLRSQIPGQIFFMGNFYNSTGWYFMPLTVLLKTPFVLVFIFCYAVITLSVHKNRKRRLLFIIPVFVIIFISVLLGLKPFVRYELPMYPFMAIIAADTLVSFINTKIRILVIAICTIYIARTLITYPYFVTYSSEFGTLFGKKYNYLSDSNLDWGQGLFALKNFSANNSIGKLLYYGTDNPDEYGFISDTSFKHSKEEDLCTLHDIKSEALSPHSYTAISITGWYYCNYYLDERFNKNKIINTVGDSLLIFKNN